MTNAAGNPIFTGDELDEHIYQVNVPVWVNVSFVGKPGMSKSEVINSITYEDICALDEGYISEDVEEVMKNKEGLVEVLNEQGEEVA